MLTMRGYDTKTHDGMYRPVEIPLLNGYRGQNLDLVSADPPAHRPGERVIEHQTSAKPSS